MNATFDITIIDQTKAFLKSLKKLLLLPHSTTNTPPPLPADFVQY